MNEDKLNSLEQEVEALKKRNQRVELEKKWETSIVRKLRIAIITYVLLSTYMYIIADSRRYVDAVVPTVGFILGGMGLRWAKDIWMKKQK